MKKSFLYHGTPFYYHDTGMGNVVILLHGFGESGNIWDTQVAFLQSYFRVIIPDLPGSGASEMPDIGESFLTMEDYAESIHSLLAHENIRCCTLIGHSMGGYIALAFAEIFPTQLMGLGLFHSTAMPDNDEKKKNRERGIAFIESNGPEAFLNGAIPNLYGSEYRARHPEQLAQHLTEARSFSAKSLIDYYRAMMQRSDRKSVLESFAKPVLFIMGEEDKTVNLQEVLPQSHLPIESHVHIWKEVAHMGMKENTEKSNDTLLEFLLHVNENECD
jgi:pimeloyl-ACP methyl ester carboxylesterase